VRSNTGHGDTTILGHVNVELIRQPVHLETRKVSTPSP
jgi:hypothetical protein